MSTTRVLDTLSTSQRERRLFANVTKSGMIKMEQNREYRKKVEHAIRVLGHYNSFGVGTATCKSYTFFSCFYHSITKYFQFSAVFLPSDVAWCDGAGWKRNKMRPKVWMFSTKIICRVCMSDESAYKIRQNLSTFNVNNTDDGNLNSCIRLEGL